VEDKPREAFMPNHLDPFNRFNNDISYSMCLVYQQSYSFRKHLHEVFFATFFTQQSPHSDKSSYFFSNRHNQHYNGHAVFNIYLNNFPKSYAATQGNHFEQIHLTPQETIQTYLHAYLHFTLPRLLGH